MISALFFLQFHSIKNRLVSRLRRLKKPKYLLGALVGGAYFYFYFGRYFISPRPYAPNPLPPNALPSLALLGALALFLIMLSAWIFPHARAALNFTEAEVAFLFPAPISRRKLIHFKLLKSQTRILVTIVFLTLLTRRFGSGSHALIHAAGWWIILSTLQLHFLGASFARTLLLDRGFSNRARRIVLLSAAVLLFSAVGLWIKNNLPPAPSADAGFTELSQYAGAVLQAGPIPWLLYPFRFIIRPFFAGNLPEFFFALLPAALILALHYAWVIFSNVAFAEASMARSRQMAERIAAVRAGHWQGAPKAKRKKKPPFPLPPLGFPPVALLWKNLLSAGQGFSTRVWFVIAWLAVIGVIVGRGEMKHGGFFSLVGFCALLFLFMSLVTGPQLLRQDFRQDLAAVEALKLFPLRGWQIVLGELLTPIVILSALQWLLLLVAVSLTTTIPGAKQTISLGLRLALGFSAAMIVPALNLIALLIPNAAVLLFPAWFQSGKEAPAGIEATGQRLIFMVGQLLVMAVALAPAAGIFAVIIFFGKNVLIPLALIPMASFAAALLLAVEGSLGIMLLGKFFERFDLSAEAGS